MTAERLGWEEVRDRLRGRVLDGTWAPGDRLPRDEDLAASFGCARTTVQRAMRALEESGIVERRRRGGTTLRRDPVTRATFDIPVTRAEVEARGQAYGHRLIRAVPAPLPPGPAARMGLPEGQGALRVEALHLADGRPFVAEDRWICLGTVPEVAEVDLGAVSANEWLLRHRPYSRCDLAVEAVTASAGEARLLAVTPGAALLAIERTTWIGEAPITTVRALAGPGYRLEARV